MKKFNQRKKLFTIIALLAIMLCALPVMAQSAREGIFLADTMLVEGNSIFLDDILAYCKIVSSDEQIENIVLPESLVMLEPGSAAEGTTSTVSGAVPIDGTTQYMVTIPCMVRPEAVQEDSVIIEGMKLFVTERPQELLGERSTEPLPNYTMYLYKTEDDVNNKTPLSNGATINLDDDLFIGITKENFIGIVPGNTYTIDLPDQFSSPPDSGTLDLKVKISGTNYKFGTLNWSTGNKTLSIVFEDFSASSGGVNIGLGNLVDITMGFKCKLDKSKLSADADGKVDIRLPGGKTINVTVPELKPQPPKVEKAVGTLGADGKASWTITYTHPVDLYPGEKPEKLVDIIPEKLKYVVGSGKVYLNNSTTMEPTSYLTYSSSDGKLTYDIAGAVLAADLAGGDKVKITYETELSEAAFSEIWENKETKYVYENKAEGVDKVDAPMTPPVTATAKLEIPADWAGGKVIDKKPVVNGTGDDRTITWTLEVLAQGQTFEELRVIDTMGKGLTLDPASVTVSKDGGSPANITPETSTDANGTVMTIKLVTGGAPSPAANKYTIIYKTKINPDYFNKPGTVTDEEISNKARLEYSWPAGVEPGSPAMPPAIEKKPGDIGVDSAVIKKEAGTYRYTDNSMTWKIHINPNQVNLTQAVFVDDLSVAGADHVFVLPGGDEAAARDTIEADIKAAMGAAGISPTVIANTDVRLENNKLTVTLGKIENKKFTFPITTYATKPESWAGNGETTYENTVTMKETDTIIGSDPIAMPISGSAKVKANNNVLKKAAGNYIPEEKKMEWTFTVNEHEVSLGHVTIKDTLSDILSCSPEDVNGATLGGVPFSGANSFTFDDSSNTITIDLDNVNAKKEIKFKTSVDVDSELFRKQKDIPISNQASIESTANPTPVNSNKADVTLVNQAIEKKGVTVNQTFVSYTINLNPVGMDLLKGKPAGTKLTISDKLPDGLYLDMESIKIYHATAAPVSAANGKYTIGLVEGGEITDAVIKYQASENSFSIDIPDPTKGYIVKYNAFIVKAGVDLKNDVKIVGSSLEGDKNHLSSQHSFRLSAFGGAGFSLPRDKFISLRIKKVDKDGNKLTGAEFALYADKKGEQLLAKGTTDDGTGICTLAIPRGAASGLDKLYWKETKAPVGYVVNDEWHEVNTASLPTTDIQMVNLQGADAALGKIKLRKTDQGGTALTGAAFAVYMEESCETLAAAEKNVDASGEVTFDGLYPGRAYWVKETKAPQGYVQGEPVSVMASGDAVTPVAEIKNDKANVTLETTKADGEDKGVKIPDVEFSLYEDAACTKQFGSTQKTNKQGKASFTNLMPHTTYYLKETKAAVDYIENTSVYTIVTENNNETITREVVNYKIGWDKKASIEINKTDASGNVALEHAVFELYESDKTTLVGEKTTDKDGRCTFPQLKEGIYYIKETKAPEGYKLDDNFIKVVVALNAKETIVVKNNPLDPKEEGTPGSGSEEGGKREEYRTDTTYDKFVQEEAAGNSTIPKTGVEDSIIWYALGLIVSLLAAAGLVLVIVRRKRR